MEIKINIERKGKMKRGILLFIVSLVCIVFTVKSDAYALVSDGLEGTWKGYYSSSILSSTSVTVTLKKKSSTKYSGTYKAGNGAKGKIILKIKDTGKQRIKMKSTTSGCSGSYRGNITYNDGSFIEFDFTGNDCSGSHKNGEGYVEKQ